MVSGIRKAMKTALDTQTPANRNILPWKLSDSIKSGSNFIIKNAKIHKSDIQNDRPKSFNFAGITSEMTKNGRVKIAHDAIKMENEKLATGIQLNASIL